MLTRMRRLTAAVGVFTSFACAARDGVPNPAPTVVLISLDGFRYDYLDRGATPTLVRLAREGVRAPLVPVFPTMTFPNHYSIVTGLYPERHGIVHNTMYDPVLDATFSLDEPAAIADGRWWEGEPVWVTLERQGRRTATFYWPGAEAEIAGHRPTYWRRYDGSVPHEDRVRQVLDWLTLPPGDRPVFVTLYLSDVDDAGHDVDPDSPAMHDALRAVDAALERLVEGLEARGLTGHVNLVITSDHGMAALHPERVVLLDEAALEGARVLSLHPVLLIWPPAGKEESVYRALAGVHPRLTVWRKEDVPARFRYRGHRRIPPIVGLLDEGWAATTRTRYADRQGRFTGGTHGYDPALPSMRGLFVGWGPAFRTGVEGAAFTNVHVHALLTRLLGIPPVPTQADPESTAQFLRPVR